MITVRKVLVYKELSPNVSDASGEVHTVKPSDTHLAVDHMAHGYSQPHPHKLHVVEAQVVQNGPQEHAGAQPCCIAVGFVQGDRIRVFNITNHFPQKYGLNYSGAFLKEKKKVLIRNVSFSLYKIYFYHSVQFSCSVLSDSVTP